MTRASAHRDTPNLMAERLARERGVIRKHGKRKLALVYPSSYAVGMSSLGLQQVYRLLNDLPDTVAERAFLPDRDASLGGGAGGGGGASGGGGAMPMVTYESGRPIAELGVIAFSIAYELEIGGVFAVLDRAGVPVRAAERRERDPWVIAGGPLTAVNPRPLAPFIDVIVLGEAEELLAPLVDGLFAGATKPEALAALAALPGYYVPSVHGDDVPPRARCATDSSLLPARSAIISPDATWENMVLVEAERGCARNCAFCVMRREASGGMRTFSRERVLGAALPLTEPLSAGERRRVGLVGAAVSDHPEIVAIIDALVEAGCEVGLSSLRADRLGVSLVAALVRGGLKTLTVAADGGSERLRELLDKRIREEHLLAAARLAGELGLSQLKTYVMVGLPGETDADIDELAACALEQAQLAGRTRTVIGAAVFVPKPHTPLAAAPFAGDRLAARRIERLRRLLGSKVEVRATSSRWAWVESLLARGSSEDGLRALAAYRDGNSFAAWRKAFRDVASP